jgi:HEAT repeat protein
MFWPVKAKGIKELAQMNITSENHLFVKYLNSRNDILGLEAQLAWIRLNPDDPLKFYDDPKIQLTDWGQVNSLIAFKKIGKIPDFGKWIESKTRIVVIFALKMTGILKEFQNELLVQQRLYDSDPEIRREAVIALGRLELSSSNPNLRQIYPRENLSNKAEILRALSITSDSENFSLFKEVLLDETDISTRILAAKGIVGLDQNCRNKLDLIFAEAEPTLKKIIMHAKDNRI